MGRQTYEFCCCFRCKRFIGTGANSLVAQKWLVLVFCFLGSLDLAKEGISVFTYLQQLLSCVYPVSRLFSIVIMVMMFSNPPSPSSRSRCGLG